MQKASGKSVRKTHGVSLPWAPAPNTGEGRPGLVPRVQKHKGSGRSSPGIWGGTLGEWSAGVREAAAPTSCQNKDQDGECWVCPLWVAWYVPPSPSQGKGTMWDRSAQAMGLQQPSWMCLPPRRPHVPPSLHAECPAWILGRCPAAIPLRFQPGKSSHLVRPSL